jgi:glucokinase
MTQALALGIDIGGTNTAFGVVNKNGEILEKSSLSTRDYDTLDDYINGLKEAITPVINRMGRENFKGAGIGAPNGNFFTGEIVFAPNLPWKGILPIKKLTQEALGMNTVITNDANAATIGEMQYGAAKGMKDFILVTLGTGVGSGFVSGGSLIYGSDGFAGELGHVIAVRNGRRCGCGRLGCLETYASATGIVRTAHEWL